MHRTSGFTPLGFLLVALAAAGLAVPGVAAPVAVWSDTAGPVGSPVGGPTCGSASDDGCGVLLGRAGGGLLEGAGPAGRPLGLAGGLPHRASRNGDFAFRPVPDRLLSQRHRGWTSYDALARAGRLACPANGPPPCGMA